MNIFIGNLSSQTSEQQLSDLFSPFGIVRSTKVIYDNFTGRSKGFAFVEMPDEGAAERAIRNLNNTVVDTQKIVVNEAKPRPERSRY
ncbi:RNA recognition motif domain-containing protein [Chitinophaga sp. Hz27]|uniref:RNA recognition motif domain-containing protein n=1 Tax=Chitinophaga sp. Hz27 TaxID=3347169 RepID=UPI0035DA1AD1